uniref:NB-ARC domain-containing protein n=1 Tax=Leersia perrieri TaxID=77586 RepID=A0A0D9XUE5_9ORYZ
MPELVDISLEIFDRLDKLPDSVIFPQCLRRLLLTAKFIKEDPMPILEKLPCLVFLFLSGYKGHTMLCSAQGFPRLTHLSLDNFYTEEWIIEIGALPRLSHLSIMRFPNMSKLPQGLGQLPFLEELFLQIVPKISDNDITWKYLQGKGCKYTVIYRLLYIHGFSTTLFAFSVAVALFSLYTARVH